MSPGQRQRHITAVSHGEPLLEEISRGSAAVAYARVVTCALPVRWSNVQYHQRRTRPRLREGQSYSLVFCNLCVSQTSSAVHMIYR
jgi:hypothetical protein